jgi:hypothetical protein
MKDITAQVVKIDNDNEVLRFTINEKKQDVTLTSKNGINELKAVYESLLAEVMKDDVTVRLEEKGEGTTAMYQNVCSEYITLLNSDLVSARHEIIEKGLATPIKGANKGK